MLVSTSRYAYLFLHTDYKLFYKSSYYYVLLLFFTLYLGSWWALQEGSWGGWWNWDPSEVFGLVITYFYLIIVHNSSTIKFYYSLKILRILFTTYLVIYFLIQLNFGLVSHNFGTRIDWFVSTDFYYLLFFIFSFILILFFLTNVFIFSKYLVLYNSKTTQSINNSCFRVLLLFFILLLQFLLSFIFIFNDFFWKFMQLNMFNNLFIWDINTTIVFLLILFFVPLMSYYYSSAFTPLYLIFNNFWFLVVSTFSFRNNLYYLSHIILLVFIFRSYLSEYSSLVFYNPGFYPHENINSLLLNSSFVNDLTLYPSYEFIKSSKNFISFLETTPSSQSFTFDSFLSKTNQTLNLSTGLNSYMITVFESFSLNLNLIFFTLFACFIRLYFHTKLIIF